MGHMSHGFQSSLHDRLSKGQVSQSLEPLGPAIHSMRPLQNARLDLSLHAAFTPRLAHLARRADK